MPRQLGGNKSRRVRIVREHFQCFFAILHTAVIKRAAHHSLLPLRMDAVVEVEIRIFSWLADGPAGKNFRHFGYVVLRVTGVHTYGVKFHHFPAIILIEAADLLLLCLLRLAARTATVGAGESSWRGRKPSAENALITLAAHRHFPLL